MFTGIIEETGEIQSIQKGARSCVLTVGCRKILKDMKIGDSICTDGVCLTATSVGSTYFTADVMPETMNRSTLGSLRYQSRVNLERAMPADGRFGGHFVSGHIDGTGIITGLKRDDNAIWYTISVKPDLMRYVVEKGSIAVDGISLTVAYTDREAFKVSVIPHTREETTIYRKQVGDRVNLECDVIGKYVEKLLMARQDTEPAEKADRKNGLTLDFLRANGF